MLATTLSDGTVKLPVDMDHRQAIGDTCTLKPTTDLRVDKAGRRGTILHLFPPSEAIQYSSGMSAAGHQRRSKRCWLLKCTLRPTIRGRTIFKGKELAFAAASKILATPIRETVRLEFLIDLSAKNTPELSFDQYATQRH